MHRTRAAWRREGIVASLHAFDPAENGLRGALAVLHTHTPRHPAERVAKRRENRQSQEPIVMGSWLFSSSHCHFASCEFRPHPGAHIWGMCDAPPSSTRFET